MFFFFFNDTATTEIYTLSLHDALPISTGAASCRRVLRVGSRIRRYPRAPRRAPRIGPRCTSRPIGHRARSEEHTSELQSRLHLVCRLLLEKKKNFNASLLLKNEMATPP